MASFLRCAASRINDALFRVVNGRAGRIEEGNMATSVLGEFILDQDVMLPAPPQTMWDFTEAIFSS